MTAESDRTPLRFKVISGGQTGVDRAGLDAAQEAGIAIGGWCPKDRRAMDGVIPSSYPLTETESRGYAVRTEWNVRDSDATLILCIGNLSGGTRLTADFARQYGKPLLIVDLQQLHDHKAVVAWLCRHAVQVLNIAGPREEDCPGCYASAKRFLSFLFSGQGRVCSSA
jgi:Circularly permutated YpsA SLOG family